MIQQKCGLSLSLWADCVSVVNYRHLKGFVVKGGIFPLIKKLVWLANNGVSLCSCLFICPPIVIGHDN